MLSDPQSATLADQAFVCVDLEAGEGPLLALARSLGEPIPSRTGNPLVSELKPATVESEEVDTFSSKFGLGGFPFHTDTAHWPLPVRFLILRSVGTSHDRPTLLIKGQKLLDSIRSSNLTRAVWKSTGPRGTFLCTLYSRLEDEQLFRFDPLCMKPMNAAATDVTKAVKAAVVEPVAIDWSLGKTVVIDNWRVLHARATAHLDDSQTRCLQRVLVFGRNRLPLFSNALAT